MNIALPALVVLLGLLPGMAFYYAYFAGRFEKRRAGVSALEEAALYVIFAIPLDVAAFGILPRVGIHVDLGVVAHMLAGSVSEPALEHSVDVLGPHLGLTAFVYLLLITISGLLGMATRQIVWRWRLDTAFGLFKWRHPWYYMFAGRYRGMPPNVLAWVDILAEHDEGRSRLYRGLVSDYDMAADGKLESITLRGARRGSGHGTAFKWVDIPSSHFVIMGGRIHSINVTYWNVDPEPEESALAAAEDPPSEQPPTAMSESATAPPQSGGLSISD